MSRALVAFLVRRHWLTCLLCILAPLLVGAVAGLIYPVLREDMKGLEALAAIIERFSPLDQRALFTPQGFFSIPFNHPLTLTGLAVAPAIPAIGLVAGERGRGGLELLLATRLERGALLRSLLAFVLPVCLLMGFSPLVGIALGAGLAGVLDEVSWTLYLGLATNAWILSTHLAGAVTLLSVLAADRARVTTWVAIYVFLGVFVAFLAGIWKAAEGLRFATPFGYLDLPAALQGESELLRDGLVLGLSGALLFGLAFLAESRRTRV